MMVHEMRGRYYIVESILYLMPRRIAFMAVVALLTDNFKKPWSYIMEK